MQLIQVKGIESNVETIEKFFERPSFMQMQEMDKFVKIFECW